MSRYDDELWELVPEERGPAPAHLLELARGLGEVERALDLGCGDGRLTAELRAREVVGVDPSRVALERARRRAPAAELLHVEVDAPLPLSDASFDLVLCVHVLDHVREKRMPAPAGAEAPSGTREEDYSEHLLSTHTHASMLFFTQSGRVFQLRVHEIPERDRNAKGQPINNLARLPRAG